MDLSARLSTALEGRYEILREIGRGGMSVVFLARDLRLDREVAIKALRPELTESVGVERFQREIQLVAHFEHIHLLQLHESGTADGMLYYVMPYTHDGSLRDLLHKERQLGLDDIVRITTEVADGLSHAHKQDVVHRDIKPENIFFVDGHAVVADFGIAHAYSEAGGETFTESGVAIGTPVYMSPEQAGGDPHIDHRSDIYSLACVVYELLSGGPPFEGPTTQAVLAKHMQEHVPSLEIVRPDLPAGMARAVEKALAKVPADRFKSAPEFAQALEAGMRAGSPPTRNLSSGSIAFATIALGVVLLLGWRFFFPPAPPLERNRIVVYPLVVSGDHQGGRGGGERVALAVGYALESTGLFRWTDGWSLLDLGARDDVRRLSQDDARSLAQAQAAGFFIDGRVVPRGDSLDVMLALHDVAGDSTIAWRSATGNPQDDWNLGLHALNELLPEITGERVELGWLTDHATAAVVRFLQGEQEYRRSHFGLALEHYESAVASDSTLAIAALRGAQAASWLRETDRAEGLVTVALDRESALPTEQVLFARGLEAYFTGAADTAVWYLKEALAHDPEWRDVWMALGEVYHHFLPNQSPLDSLAEAAFATAQNLDSAFTPPLYHLAEFAILGGDLEAAGDMLDRFSRGSPDTSLTQQLFLMYNCVARGDEAVDWKRAVRESPFAVLLAAKSLAVAGAQPECAEHGYRALLQHDTTGGAGLQWGAVHGFQSLLMAEGRYDEVGQLLDSAVATGFKYFAPLYVLDAAAGAPLDSRAAAYIGGLSDRYSELQSATLWVLGIWHAHQGTAADVEEIAGILASRASANGGRMDRLLADALAAHAALARTDSAEALGLLTALRPTARSGPLSGFPWESLGPERLALAELLFARGELEAAATVATRFDSPAPVSYLLYLPASLSLRLRVAEARGDAAAAEKYRTRLVALGRHDLIGLVP